VCSVDNFSWLTKRNEQWDRKTPVFKCCQPHISPPPTSSYTEATPRIPVDRHHVSLELPIFSLQPYLPVFAARLAILFTHYTGDDNRAITLATDTCLALIHIAQRGSHSTHRPSEHFLLPQYSPISGLVHRSHYQLCPLTSVNGNDTNCKSSAKWQILARMAVVRIPAGRNNISLHHKAHTGSEGCISIPPIHTGSESFPATQLYSSFSCLRPKGGRTFSSSSCLLNESLITILLDLFNLVKCGNHNKLLNSILGNYLHFPSI